jgi:hypothetical protein
MKRVVMLVLCGVLLSLAFPLAAFALSWNPVSWVKAGIEAGGVKVLAWLFTALLGLSVFGTVLAVKIIATLKEAGELLATLGEALADRKMTAEELRQIGTDARDVFNIWKTTPDEYKPKVE